MTALAAAPARDARVISLIGVAHAVSHFNQLVLPPLFPLLIVEFGVGYTELALLITLLYAVSGIAQTPAGFAVDRFGARNVLVAGTVLMCLATVLLGLAPGYWSMLPLVVLAGLGNSVFHPSDYSILSASVDPRRLGRAYGVHTLGGNLGWALAPISILGLATLFGWRMALVIAGLVCLSVPVLLLAMRAELRDDGQRAHGTPASLPGEALAPLLSRPVVTCFIYFVLLSIAVIGLQSFLPSTLNALYGTALDWAGAALTGFLLGSSAGVMAGAVLADRSSRHETLVMIGLGLAAALVIFVGATPLTGPALVGVIAAAGFFSGSTTPSRDMLVRSAAPKGATGRVFGFVYSGLDAGSALGPLIVGLLLDHRLTGLALPFLGLAMALAGASALTLRRSALPVPLPAE